MSRRLLIHYLLLFAVVFHTVVGVPLHEATHLPGGHAHAHVHDEVDSTPGDDEHAAHGHEDGALNASAESACTWCQSLGQLGLAIALLPPHLPAAAGTGRWLARAQANPNGAPDHRRYAARAPPARSA